MIQSKTNLNDLRIVSDEGEHELIEQRDYGYRSQFLDVHFKNIKDELIKFIRESEHILGCIAWLTDPEILDALSTISCSLFVQKEDFLRPDVGARSNFKDELRRAYGRLTNRHLIRYNAPGHFLHRMSVCGDPDIDPVRVVGNHNRAKHSAFPRMHNKFLVACQFDAKRSACPEITGYPEGLFTPYAVWTGSFNFTKNAGMSFENAVVIRDLKIAEHYANEWSQIGAFSEPLDWGSEWCAPEWRIGT